MKPSWFLIPFIALLAVAGSRADDAPGKVTFVSQIQPILQKHCYACHGPEKQKSGLRLDQRDAALLGGDLGKAIVPGQSDKSPLYRYVAGLDADMVMPPKEPRLSAGEVALIKQWIDGGAVWPTDSKAAVDTWWSLKPLLQGAPPVLPQELVNWQRTPIDAFILQKLMQKGLKPSGEADRRTLIRRLMFDLLGLPPTPEEVERFVNDPDPQAYEKLVDACLSSPRYGERWARHWLDVVHYGETHGYDKDQPRPHAWPYRDYVIRAFNEDKPYGRFIEEQLAGDVLYPDTRDGIEALGFIAAGPWDFIGHAELPETKIDGKIARHLDRDDMVANTINTFQSMTVHCAQCHNHKFDPIPSEDYYRLQAVFAAVDRADKPYGISPALLQQRQHLQKQLSTAKQQLDAMKKKQPTPGFLSSVYLQHLLAERAYQRLQAELKALPAPQLVYAGTVHPGQGNFLGTGNNGGKPRPIYLLNRGNVQKPGREVTPGTLSVLKQLPSFTLPVTSNDGERRAALAQWIAHRDNPLTWRSIVNRVWLYHFGQGIVESPNDFGRMGQLPSHPELLDWLANDFRQHGSLKKLHRLIVTSAVYRQTSQPEGDNARALGIDSGNRLLWRMNRRRLEAEPLRDSVLQTAGKLNLTMGGPSYQDYVVEKPEHSPHYRYELKDPSDPKLHRRAIYRSIVRSQQNPWMATLDCADPSILVDKRNQTASPLQALALLNDPLVLVMSKELAKRVQKEPEPVAVAMQLLLQRNPSEDELKMLNAYVKQHGLEQLGRLLWNLNEFTMVD